MEGLLTFAVAMAAVWLGLLTFVMLLVVRQIGVLSFRLSRLSGSNVNLDADGPPIGTLLPPEVAILAPELMNGRVPLMLVSATCMPCRESVSRLDGRRLAPGTCALVAGRAELADGIADTLPASVRVVRDPVATRLANTLEISSTPFGLLIQDGEIVRKAYLHSVDDFLALSGAPNGKAAQTLDNKEPANVG